MKLFSAPSPPPSPPPPPPAPTKEQTAEQAEAERRKAVLEAAQRRGRAQTILTGSEGATATAPTVRKELLGA